MWGWGGGKAKEAVASSSDGGFAPAAAAGRPDGAGLATAVATAAEEGRRPQHTHHEHIDDAPMTPVVYIVSMMAAVDSAKAPDTAQARAS
jgi:hypothetical protein